MEDISDSAMLNFRDYKRAVSTLQNPDLKTTSQRSTNRKKKYFIDMFRRLNQSLAYNSLFSTLWHSSLPCYDVKKVTSNTNGFRLIMTVHLIIDIVFCCASLNHHFLSLKIKGMHLMTTLNTE